MKQVFYALLIIAAFGFSSCEKCFNCVTKEYCAVCVAGTASNTQCFVTAGDRDNFITGLGADSTTAGFTCTKKENIISEYKVCDKKDEVYTQVENYKFRGYECTETDK
jgi:hypothetical protein